MKLNKLFLLALSSLLLLSGCNTAEPTSVEVAAPPASLVLYGDVTADNPQLITLDFPAKITAVHVKNGDILQKNDILFTLDFSDYLLQMSSKEKELEEAQIQLKNLEQSLNPQLAQYDATSENLALKKKYLQQDSDPEIIPLESELELLEKEATTAKSLYETNQELFTNGLLAQKELEASEQAYKAILQKIEATSSAIEQIKDARTLEVNTLSNELKSLKSQISNTDQEKSTSLEKLRVQIALLEETICNMKSKLDKSYLRENTIIAPVNDMVVYDIAVMNGSDLSSTNGILGKLLSQDSLYILADIPEESLSLVKEGQPVSISLAGHTDSQPVLAGTISQIAGCATLKDGDTVVEAHIQVTEGSKHLKAGLSADIIVSY